MINYILYDIVQRVLLGRAYAFIMSALRKVDSVYSAENKLLHSLLNYFLSTHSRVYCRTIPVGHCNFQKQLTVVDKHNSTFLELIQKKVLH